MAGEALPWLLKRIEDTLNENDKLPRNHRLMSQDGLRSSLSCVIPRRGVTAVMIKVHNLDIKARACTLCNVGERSTTPDLFESSSSHFSLG